MLTTKKSSATNELYKEPDRPPDRYALGTLSEGKKQPERHGHGRSKQGG
ncbi:hypothetical protein ACFSQT_11555 [Mesorhizobium calcicola]|uniref:Uncharacterized protein n=1 Tax=Mesorhizobium calcicola TaxID=1300310 RepID=A0ABW4WCW0_9HYPH